MEIEAQAGAPETPEQFVARRDQAIHTWLNDRSLLTTVKAAENGSRLTVSEILFPQPKKGTNRFYLNNGYAIKLVHGINYTLGDKDLVNVDTQEKIPVDVQVDNILDQIAAVGNEGATLADNLVKWKPELNEKAYLALDPENPTHKRVKELIDSILTTRPASPQLTFEEPKAK